MCCAHYASRRKESTIESLCLLPHCQILTVTVSLHKNIVVQKTTEAVYLTMSVAPTGSNRGLGSPVQFETGVGNQRSATRIGCQKDQMQPSKNRSSNKRFFTFFSDRKCSHCSTIKLTSVSKTFGIQTLTCPQNFHLGFIVMLIPKKFICRALAPCVSTLRNRYHQLSIKTRINLVCFKF